MIDAIKDSIIRAVILVGFVVLLLQLILNNQLSLYIHPRFTNLVDFSAGMFLLMLLQECWYLKKIWRSVHEKGCKHTKWAKYIPFMGSLLIVFILPNSALNASLVTNKGLNSQLNASAADSTHSLAAELEETNFIKISDHNYIGIMTEFYHHPEQYTGKNIEVMGFAFKNPSDPANCISLVRYVIGCCTADASPYGILCKTEDTSQLINGNWYEIQGMLQDLEVGEKNIPMVKVTWVKQVSKPACPYIFP